MAISPAQPSAAPIFIGIILNWCFLGSLAVQIYIYYLHSENDRLGIRAIVYALLIMDLTQTGLATDYAWKTLVQQWGNLEILEVPPPTSISITIMAGIISAVVQLFFAWRIWVLNKSTLFRVFPALIVLVALMQSISALVASIRFATVKELTALKSLTSGFTVWLVGSFVADILIAGCMIYTLKQAQKSSFSTRSETILARLVRNTIQTGAVTAVAAGVELILFLSLPSTNYHFTPAFLLGKLYSNVLLANLNARAQNRRLGMDSHICTTVSHRLETSLKLGKINGSLTAQGIASSKESGTPGTAVCVETQVTEASDYGNLEVRELNLSLEDKPPPSCRFLEVEHQIQTNSAMIDNVPMLAMFRRRSSAYIYG